VLLWEAWKAYAHRAASYQSTVLLTIVYALVLGPGALLGRMFGARLLDLQSSGSTWIVRPSGRETLESLKRQF
jgi:hypothetical protein